MPNKNTATDAVRDGSGDSAAQAQAANDIDAIGAVARLSGSALGTSVIKNSTGFVCGLPNANRSANFAASRAIAEQSFIASRTIGWTEYLQTPSSSPVAVMPSLMGLTFGRAVA